MYNKGMKIKRMPETQYRASRLCRVLGNPTAYKILRLLCRSKKKPSEIATILGLSKSTVSQMLLSLKLADLVRYDTLPVGRIYWLKDKSIIKLLDEIEEFIEKARAMRW